MTLPNKGINSPLRLFSDDCLLYRVISSVEDTTKLQEDLDRLSEWANHQVGDIMKLEKVQ